MPIYKPEPLKGLNQITAEERDAFVKEQVALGKLPKNWKFSQADRLYKNKQFRDKYGEDVYSSITDKASPNYLSAAQRDEWYDRMEYDEAVSQKFANDPNLQYYKNMTTEGLKDLWDSGILSPEELDSKVQDLENSRQANNIYKPKSRILSAFINAGMDDEGPSAVSAKDLSDAVAYSRGLLSGEKEAEVAKKLEREEKLREAKVQGGVAFGLDDKAVDAGIKKLKADNAKKIQDLQMREDERILALPAVQQEARTRANSIYEKINKGELTYEELRKTFREVFDNDLKDEPTGSRYYTGYKDRIEMANFGVDDMIQALSEFSVLSEAYGDSSKAMQTIDTKMFNFAKENQSFWRRRANTLRGVATKATAMAANEVLAYRDLYHSIADTPDEYKKFKTAEDVLTSGGASFLANPNYWNYSDQYGIWDPYEIQRINDNGGIGGRMNLYSPIGKMTGEQFVDESFKMLGYMLPAVAISAATKNVPRTSPWAKVIAGAEIFGSAAALGSAYSSGTYNEITLGAEQALDKMFYDESGDFIKKYYAEHPDFIDNYFAAAGVKRDDSDLITIPTQMAAEKALYEEAKEAYFSANEDRRAAYKEAQDRVLKDAQLGASVDNLIETGRMMISGAFWGKWTKSQLTRDLANRGYNPVKYYGDTFKQATTKGAAARKATAMTLLNGGVDNWLDDITAGIGKGLGLGDYNNYLGTIYGPDNYVEGAKYATSLVDGIIWGYNGAEEAFYNPQTWIDGAIGAAGSVFGTRLNAITLIRDAAVKEGMFSKGDKAADWKALSAWEKINRYVTNGVTTSIADSYGQYKNTEEYVKNINENVLPKYQKDITDLGNFLRETYNFGDMANDVLANKDIKQISMTKSAIRIMQALKDPLLAQMPAVQQFSQMLNRGRQGNFTMEEIENFINDPNNIYVKNAVDANGNSRSVELATKSMQQNIKKFLEIADKYNELERGLSKNRLFSTLGQEAKTQIAVQMLLNDVWLGRLDAMQSILNTKDSEKTPWNYAAEFGSVEGKNRAIASLEKYINKQREQLTKYSNEAKVQKEAYEMASTPEEREEAYKKYLQVAYIAQYFTDAVQESESILREKKSAKVDFDEKGNARVLSKEEIMRLSPRQRADMLNPENSRNYSEEQRRIINDLRESLKNHVSADGSTVEDLYQVVLDAGTMADRIEASSKSIRAVSKDPFMLKEYITRLNERRAYLLYEGALSDIREGQLKKLDDVHTPEEAVDVVFRGRHPANTADKGFYIPADIVDEYLKEHPEAASYLIGAREMVRTLDDLYMAADSLFTTAEAQTLKEVMAKAVIHTNSKEEMMSALEELIDTQTDPTAKMQFDKVLERMKTLGYQRDATKIRNRELERQRKQEEENKRLAEEAKKDGKNYDWDGYKVGDTIYNKTSGASYVVTGFTKGEKSSKMVAEVKYADGTTGIFTFDSAEDKDSITKNKLEQQSVEEVNFEEGTTEVVEEQNPLGKNVVQTGVEEVNLEVDGDGKVDSPSAEQQAAATHTTAVSVPAVDPTEQGNVIPEVGADIISGTRLVEYSVDALKDGRVELEVPKDPNSLFGRFREWLDNNKIKLQEIIDEEFGRILTDNPDVEISFMVMPKDKSNALTNLMFNVIELTPQIRQKYHKEERGGVFQANGKTWLLVGTTGFAMNSSKEHMNAWDTMKGPINQRRDSYFSANPNEHYYVDTVAHTRVQNTTSGRIVNQRLGETAPRLKRVSELLKSAGIKLEKGQFGIQTKEVGKKSFLTTSNVDRTENTVFPPRNAEDNRGRTFVLIDTANGNKIPGMIEPAMYNQLADGSKLKELINKTIAKLFSTNYATRNEAIKELCGYLVLDEHKNILIGNEKADVITIKREGVADITQKLGKDFDIAKFFDDLEKANFQINVPIKVLEDPFLLKLYDESDALMTTVDSMRTAGMSYTVYMTDASGKPIIITPVGNAQPGTGTYKPKQYRSARVNNTTYEFKNSQWINRSNGNVVNPGTKLETSIIYNEAINDSQRPPIYTKDGLEYYNFVRPDGVEFLVSRDGLGNVEILSDVASKGVMNELQRRREEQQRIENLEEVNLDDGMLETQPVTPQTQRLTQEQINQQAVGEFVSPTPEVKPETQKEVIVEAKEEQPQQPKEIITNMGNKSLAELQKTEKLSTFATVFADMTQSEKLYEVLESKDWGITGVLKLDEAILKEHNVPIENIGDIDKWIDLIRDCR